MLDKINQTENLANYFYNFPVSYEDLHLGLSFNYLDELTLKKDEVVRISIYDNVIRSFIVEIEEPAKIQEEEVISDVYVLNYDDFFRKNRVIRESPRKKQK